jgi:hypothetical protein
MICPECGYELIEGQAIDSYTLEFYCENGACTTNTEQLSIIGVTIGGGEYALEIG